MPDPIPDHARLAVVVSHPAHLLTILGILLRWRPHILMLDEALTGPGAGQTSRIQMGLNMVGLSDRASSFEIDEDESYRRALQQDHAYHIALSDRILAWLGEVNPTHVLGDAFEASNFQHDIGRLMLDDAIDRFRDAGHAVENLEFPLSSALDEPEAPLVYGRFLTGEWCDYRLDEAQIRMKRQAVQWARGQDAFVDHVADEFPSLEIESYRPVPATRDYLSPPGGLALHYDVRGREEVAAGKYETAISFDEHFVPLVRALARARA